MTRRGAPLFSGVLRGANMVGVNVVRGNMMSVSVYVGMCVCWGLGIEKWN